MRYIVVPIRALASVRAEPAQAGEARPGADGAHAYDAAARRETPAAPAAESTWDGARNAAWDTPRAVTHRDGDAGHNAGDKAGDVPADLTGDKAGVAVEETPEVALARWIDAARVSLDACLVVDAVGTVAGLSVTAADLLGTEPGLLVGQRLDDVLNLVDFTDVALEARGIDRRIPPLIAVRENSLSRGMMRLRRPDGNRLMLDAVAAPIHDGERNPIGAVSFLASISV